MTLLKGIALGMSTAVLFAACGNNQDTGLDLPSTNKFGTHIHNLEEENVLSKHQGDLDGLFLSNDLTKKDGNYFTRNPELDDEEGTSSDWAIVDFELSHKKQIIVAVIDSGVDHNHEDLKDVMWNNPGETGLDENGNDKSSNGIDDDENGYVDDIYGWNFIGGADGAHIDKETLEMTREVVRFKKRIAAGDVLNDQEKKYFEVVKKAVEDEKEYASSRLEKYIPIQADIDKNMNVLKTKLGQEDFSLEALEAIDSTDSEVINAKEELIKVVKRWGSVARIQRALDYFNDILNYYVNEDFDPRTKIVGDNPDDFSDVNYGNNDVIGPDAGHGTHVAGIIAASRDNDLGINGVAANVRIMALRAVPNGDERDKDIALAIRYAADNGANIINMSFGKDFSPDKVEVDKAFLYAAEKGVLIMNAAGNDNRNVDKKQSFPNKYLSEKFHESLEIPSFMSIGASSRLKNLMLPASFSNYGKKGVDLFAPGHQILSTTPGNKYDVYSGTSMACPAAAGVAALVWSQFPEMTAEQLKDLLNYTSRKYDGFKVRLPGAETFDLPVMFSGLSKTGGVIDAHAAIGLAKELSEN
ncbi:MAG: S8 family serine peptidase [Bdellovibrionales bacterium]